MTRCVALHRKSVDAELFAAGHPPLVARTPGPTPAEVTRILAVAPAPMPTAVPASADRSARREGLRGEQWAEAGRDPAGICGLEPATISVVDDPEELDLGR